jgi:phytol kinase
MLIQVALIIGSVLILLAFMQGVRSVGMRFDWSPEAQRKAVHVATGTYALTLPLLFNTAWPVLLLVAVTIVVMGVLRLPRFAKHGLSAAIHSVERKSYGDMLFAIAVGFLFFRSTGNLVFFALPILVLTLSDTAAALAGSTYGRRIFQIEAGTKSLEGVAIFFLVTWIIAMVLLLLMTDIARLNVVVLGLLVAAFGALVEADSWSGFDNLFLPVGLHLFLEAHMTTPPMGLLGLAICFIGLMGAILTIAPRYGLTNHSARIYAVALFLIGCYTEPQNALLPALAIVAHIWSRLQMPTRSSFPDLDSIATLAAVSFLWLFAGEWFGWSAISFYSMTFAGIAVALVALGLAARPLRARAAIAVLFAAAIAAVFQWVTGLGPAASHWHGDLTVPLVVSLATASGVTTLFPSTFERFRSPRVAILCGSIPAVTYLAKVLL